MSQAIAGNVRGYCVKFQNVIRTVKVTSASPSEQGNVLSQQLSGELMPVVVSQTMINMTNAVESTENMLYVYFHFFVVFQLAGYACHALTATYWVKKKIREHCAE